MRSLSIAVTFVLAAGMALLAGCESAVENDPPRVPSIPSGPTSGKTDSTYQFSAAAVDPDGDSVAVRFCWGDGDTSAWSSLVASSDMVTSANAWTDSGTYSVKAQARDKESAASAWSAARQVAISGGGDSSGDSGWEKTHGGLDFDQGYCVRQTPDGGYIIVGSTYSYSVNGSSDIYLLKTDTSGDESWYQAFGGQWPDHGYSVRQTQDDGYIIAGTAYGFNHGNADLCLIKTDATGTQQWFRTFGTEQQDDAYSVVQTSDGGYLLAGYGHIVGPGHEFYYIKVDASGNTVWSQKFGGTGCDMIYSAVETSDGYLLAGYTDSYGAGLGDACLLKTDASGNHLWLNTFGGANGDRANSVQKTPDGGYILTGTTTSFGAGGSDVYLVKTDASGTETWHKTFGGTEDDAGNSIERTSDGGYIIAGETKSFGVCSTAVYLIKTDATGNLVWSKTFDGTGHDYGKSAQQTSDGGYIVVGSTYSYGAGSADVYLIKTDENGDVVSTFVPGRTQER